MLCLLTQLLTRQITVLPATKKYLQPWTSQNYLLAIGMIIEWLLSLSLLLSSSFTLSLSVRWCWHVVQHDSSLVDLLLCIAEFIIDWLIIEPQICFALGMISSRVRNKTYKEGAFLVFECGSIFLFVIQHLSFIHRIFDQLCLSLTNLWTIECKLDRSLV